MQNNFKIIQTCYLSKIIPMQQKYLIIGKLYFSILYIKIQLGNQEFGKNVIVNLQSHLII